MRSSAQQSQICLPRRVSDEFYSYCVNSGVYLDAEFWCLQSPTGGLSAMHKAGGDRTSESTTSIPFPSHDPKSSSPCLSTGPEAIKRGGASKTGDRWALWEWLSVIAGL